MFLALLEIKSIKSEINAMMLSLPITFDELVFFFPVEAINVTDVPGNIKSTLC